MTNENNSLIPNTATPNTGAELREIDINLRQREEASAAYALLGLTMPEKAEKKCKSKTGRKYIKGYKDIVEAGRKVRVSDLVAFEGGVESVDSESLARTLRAYIAYKIGHSLKEIEMENGLSCFSFVNRINKRSKTLADVDMANVSAWDWVATFYKDCMGDITDKWAILKHNDGRKMLLAVKSGHFHIVEVAVPEIPTETITTTESADAA